MRRETGQRKLPCSDQCTDSRSEFALWPLSRFLLRDWLLWGGVASTCDQVAQGSMYRLIARYAFGWNAEDGSTARLRQTGAHLRRQARPGF